MNDINYPNIGMTLSRDLMPQIKDQKDFMSFLKTKGINYDIQTVPTNDLKSTQSEFDKDKIMSIMNADQKKIDPIITSSDGYVVDGHHRWIANHNTSGKCKSYVVNMPALDLLKSAKDYNNGIESTISEEITHKQFGPMMDSFVSFASDHLGIKSLPKIRYKDVNDDFSSFGAYNPHSKEIVLQTKNRHPMDVFRTLAHELVHHWQKENGLIGKDVAKEGSTGSKVENKANAEAGVILRHWGKKNSHMFNSGALVEAFLAEAATMKTPIRRIKPANRARKKALFYAGGPGSGKDYVAKQTGYGHGLTEVNSDHAFEHLLGKQGLSKTLPPEQMEKRTAVRSKAKGLTKIRQNALLSSGRGVIINTTGHDSDKIKAMKGELENRGYDTKMVFVNTSNEVSRQRNENRGKSGGRKVPEDVRQEYWNKAQAAKNKYRKMFGNEHFHHIDNSLDMKTASDDEKAAKHGEFTDVFKKIRSWATAIPENPIGKKEIEAELAKRRRKPKAEVIPASTPAKPRKTVFGAVSPEANATAKGLGLKHYGAGYFGPRKKGPRGEPIITHREVNGKLTKVSPKKKPLIPQQPIKEDLRQWFDPKHPKGGWKRINAKGEAIGPCAREEGEAKPKCMSNEKRAKLSKKERAAAVAAKRKHDPNPERKGEPINVSNFGKGKLTEENKPTNPELWARAKSLAKQKFDVYPSAYANGWASKWYKSKGGGWKSVNEEFEDFIEEEYGAGFWGTDELAQNYVAATPGQKYWKGKAKNAPDAGDTLLGRTAQIHPLVPEETQPKKKKKWKRKALAQEVYDSKTDTALNVKGLPSGGGIGPEFSSPASPTMIGGMAGSPYGTGMPSNYMPYYGFSESVETWANSPKTISAYKARYGSMAQQKLNEDKNKMAGKTIRQLREAWEAIGGRDMGTVPAAGRYKDGAMAEESPAWQRKEGKRESGGLNRKGVESYRRENPGSKLQTAVTTDPSKLKKGSKASKRRLSFCRRMKGMKAKLTSAKTARDPDSRINKSLRAWNCEE